MLNYYNISFNFDHDNVQEGFLNIPNQGNLPFSEPEESKLYLNTGSHLSWDFNL